MANVILPIITNDYEAFKHIKNSLILQGEKSMNADNDCAYRGYSEFILNEAKKEAGDIDGIGDYDSDLFYDFLCNQPTTLACAAGFLMSDRLYDDYLEGQTVDSPHIDVIKESNPLWEFTDYSWNMIMALQNLHDQTPPMYWEHNFESLEQFFVDNKFTYEGKMNSFELLFKK
jgi:hypothetical protein